MNPDRKSNERFDISLVSKRKNRVFIVDRVRCKGCKTCVVVCPYDALNMSTTKTKNGNFFPIEKGKCVACRKCLYACPDFALSIFKVDEVSLDE